MHVDKAAKAPAADPKEAARKKIQEVLAVVAKKATFQPTYKIDISDKLPNIDSPGLELFSEHPGGLYTIWFKPGPWKLSLKSTEAPACPLFPTPRAFPGEKEIRDAARTLKNGGNDPDEEEGAAGEPNTTSQTTTGPEKVTGEEEKRAESKGEPEKGTEAKKEDKSPWKKPYQSDLAPTSIRTFVTTTKMDTVKNWKRNPSQNAVMHGVGAPSVSLASTLRVSLCLVDLFSA